MGLGVYAVCRTYSPHLFVQKLKVKLSMKNDFELSKCSPEDCEIIGWSLNFIGFLPYVNALFL